MNNNIAMLYNEETKLLREIAKIDKIISKLNEIEKFTRQNNNEFESIINIDTMRSIISQKNNLKNTLQLQLNAVKSKLKSLREIANADKIFDPTFQNNAKMRFYNRTRAKNIELG